MSPNRENQAGSALEENLSRAFSSLPFIKSVFFSGKIFQNGQTPFNPEIAVEAESNSLIPAFFEYATHQILQNKGVRFWFKRRVEEVKKDSTLYKFELTYSVAQNCEGLGDIAYYKKAKRILTNLPVWLEEFYKNKKS